MDFQEMLRQVREERKANPVYGGTYEIHYTDPELGKMVAYVEAYSEKKSGIRKAAIEKAQTEQHIDPATITSVRKYD